MYLEKFKENLDALVTPTALVLGFFLKKKFQTLFAMKYTIIFGTQDKHFNLNPLKKEKKKNEFVFSIVLVRRP